MWQRSGWRREPSRMGRRRPERPERVGVCVRVRVCAWRRPERVRVRVLLLLLLLLFLSIVVAIVVLGCMYSLNFVYVLYDQ